MRLFLIASLSLLSACSNMSGMQQSYTELTTSSLVGTWTGELKCKNRYSEQDVILTFKQSSFPLIAEGQAYSRATAMSGKVDYMTIQIEGEMSLTGNAHVEEKAWIVKPTTHWNLNAWQGTRTAPDTIRMSTCGTEMVLTKVSDEFISDLRPKAAFLHLEGMRKTAGN